MNPAPHITCIGEIIVDLLSTKPGTSLSGSPGFLKFAGGAPANVAVGLAKLGIRSSFIGRVGNDPFGKFLTDELRHSGVDVSGVRIDNNHKTRLAFVSLTKTGERNFEFWERFPADEQFRKSDINKKTLERSDIVHLSSFLLLSEQTRTFILNLAEELHRKKVMISCDPNLRLSLWKSPAEAKRVINRMIQSSSILHVNKEEALFLTGSSTIAKAAVKLLSQGPLIVVITQGAKGCSVYTNNANLFIKSFRVTAVDTTGCGDGFLAGFLKGIALAGCNIRDLTSDDLRSHCIYANAVAAITATRKGVIAALPTPAEVKRFLSTHNVS